MKLWVYDPTNQNRSLNSPGIWFNKENEGWKFLSSNSDGTIYGNWNPGTYIFDTVEPSLSLASTYPRRTYTVIVDKNSQVSINSLAPNKMGFFTVTTFYVPNASSNSFTPKTSCQLLDNDKNSSLSVGFPRVKDRLRASGTIKALFIPVDFVDLIGTGKPSLIYYEMGQGLNNYFRKVSSNKVSFEIEILEDYVHLPFESTKHKLGTWNGGNPNSYWEEAISVADQFVDYSKFDVIYVLSPTNILFSSIAYGPAFPKPFVTNDGEILNGSFSGADAYQNIPGASWKWIAHETGHLFGLHDLYTVAPQAQTFGSWDLMSLNWSTKAIELSSWNRYISSWLEESDVVCLTTEEIQNKEQEIHLIPLVKEETGKKAVFIRISQSRILVAEYRRSGGLDVIPDNEAGVLVYTVDMDVETIKGGWNVQRRVGSKAADFTDAALRSGDKISVEGLTIEVLGTTESFAKLKISKP